MSLNVSPAQIVAESNSPLLAIADRWSRISLGEVADIINGFPLPSMGFNARGAGEPVIRIRDVGKAEPSTWFQGNAIDAPRVSHGHILVGMDGDFRVARWVGPTALLNQRVCSIRVTKPGVMDERFLLLALPGYLNAINEHTSSITVKHLSSRTVADIPLPLPSLDEQRGIVEIIEEQFSRFDAADKWLRRAKQRVDQLERAAFAITFRTDAPRRALKEIARTSSGGTPPRAAPGNYGGAIPWVKSGELGDSTVRQTSEFITDGALRGSSAKIVRQGALLMAMYGATVGKLGVLDIDAATNQAVCAIEPYDPQISTYLLYCLRALRPQLLRAAKGGAQPNISQGIIRELLIPIPLVEERQRIEESVTAGVEAANRLRSALDGVAKKSARMRTTVLHEAFAGRLYLSPV